MLKIDFWNIFCIVVNLVVLYLFMKRFVFGPVLKVIDQRKMLLEGQFASASEAERKAMELKKQYETSIQTAEAESARILEEARENGEAEYRRIVEEAGEKADRMVANAQTAIAEEKEKVLREMESDIAALAMDAAEKILKENKGGWF